MAKQTFTAWLGKQEYRQDPVGHLARVWAEFTPGRISSVAGVSRVLREIAERSADGPVPAALEAMTAAVAEYEHRDDPRPALAAVPDAGPNRADDEGAEPPGSPALTVPGAFITEVAQYVQQMGAADAGAVQDYLDSVHCPACDGNFGSCPHIPDWLLPMPREAAAQRRQAQYDESTRRVTPSMPVHDAQGRYDGARALAHQRIDPTRWQVTSAPQGTLEALGDSVTRVLGMLSLIGATLGITPEDAAGAVEYAGARDLVPHLPAIRLALEFAVPTAKDPDPYLAALAALFPADYGTQDPEIVLTGDDRLVPDGDGRPPEWAGDQGAGPSWYDGPPPDPGYFAGLWAAADFSTEG